MSPSNWEGSWRIVSSFNSLKGKCRSPGTTGNTFWDKHPWFHVNILDHHSIYKCLVMVCQADEFHMGNWKSREWQFGWVYKSSPVTVPTEYYVSPISHSCSHPGPMKWYIYLRDSHCWVAYGQCVYASSAHHKQLDGHAPLPLHQQSHHPEWFMCVSAHVCSP